jgi:hypothetical protein
MKAALGVASCRKRRESNLQVHSGPTTRWARTLLTRNERGVAYQESSLAGGPQSAQGVEARTVGYLGSPQSRSARSLKKCGLPEISVRAVQLCLALLPPARTISNISPQYARPREADQQKTNVVEQKRSAA